MDDIHKVLVPLHHACSYRREETHSPTPNTHGICQSQWKQKSNLPSNSKGNCTSPGGQFSPKESKQNRQYSTQLVENIQVLCKDGKIVIPKVLQHRAVNWYYHYLRHPGQTHPEEMLHAAMYWTGTINTIQLHVKICHTFHVNKQHKHKYGKIPTKLVITKPWETLCVDL